MVWTGECAAAAAGVLRAMTLRFSTLEEGRDTLARMFEAPSELVRVGVA